MRRNVERDSAIVNFVGLMRVVAFSTIKEIFFKDKAIRTAHQVMQRLCSEEYQKLETKRYLPIGESIYWLPPKKPKQIEHMLFRSEFLKHMYEHFIVYKYQCELEHFEGIRPDMFISFETGKGTKYNGFLETELNNNGMHFVEKYSEFYKKGDWHKYFSTFPILFIITNKKKVKTDTNILTLIIDEEFINFNEVIKEIE